MTSKTKMFAASLISFFLGLIFIKAGMEKLNGIPDIIGPPDLIEVLAKHDLKLLGQFIAYSQIVIGFLLLTNRFRTIGAIMLLPLLMNILVVTISLQWNGTPYVVSGLLVLNVILLLIDANKIKLVFSDIEYKELVDLKVKRQNIKIDIYYIFLLAVILIGTTFGWTNIGKSISNKGLFLILISMLVINIYKFIKRKTNTRK